MLVALDADSIFEDVLMSGRIPSALRPKHSLVRSNLLLLSLDRQS
jgi:hypothetical protein